MKSNETLSQGQNSPTCFDFANQNKTRHETKQNNIHRSLQQNNRGAGLPVEHLWQDQ